MTSGQWGNSIEPLRAFLGIPKALEEIRKQKGKKVYLYGFHQFTKGLLMRLTEAGISVDGFLVEDAQQELIGTNYLNHRILTLSDVLHRQDPECVIVGLSNKQVHALPARTHHTICPYLSCPVNRAMIYGRGKQARKAYEFLRDIGIEIIGFDATNGKDAVLGKPMASPKMPEKDSAYLPIIIALDNMDETGTDDDLSMQGILGRAYRYGGETMENLFFPWMYFRMSNQTMPEFCLSSAMLYRHICNAENKRLVLCGHLQDIASLSRIFSFFKLHVAYGIDCDGFHGKKNGVLYLRLPDLLHQEISEIIVLVLPDAVRMVQCFVRDFPIECRIFYQAFVLGAGIWYQHFLDPNLGYNMRRCGEESFVVLQSLGHREHKAHRIGIIGNSTSDVTCFNETAWPEYLRDMMEEANLRATLYAGGTSGYIVAQELVKFIRDMSHLPMDILISCSRVNEPSNNGHFFAHPMQKSILSSLVFLHESKPSDYNITTHDLRKDDVHGVHELHQMACLGKGIADVAEHWLHGEQILSMICQELGIKFYAIAQPWLLEKQPLNIQDKEMVENCFPEESMRSLYMRKLKYIRQTVRRAKQKFPWLIDFTRIFDGCDEQVYADAFHMTSRGNYRFAEKVFQLIADDLWA